MKIKLLLSILFSYMAISGMEGPSVDNLNLNKILVEPASLKLAAAWKIATGTIRVPVDKVPTEVLEYVNQVKSIASYDALPKEEKEFLINIMNNPEVDINQKFPSLLNRYYYISGENNKQNILNWILLYSTIKEKLDIIELMLAFGADVNAQNKIKRNLSHALALHEYNLYKGIIKLSHLEKRRNAYALQSNLKDELLSFGEQTPLIIASILGNEQIVKALIKAGADVNIQDQTGSTALMWTLLLIIQDNIEVYYNEIANMLIDANTNINLQDFSGESAKDLITKYGITKKSAKNCSTNCVLI